MKSDVSDVGSHVVIDTNNKHQGLNRTPVTTADHFGKEALWTRTVHILS